jgi:plastocyanin
MVSRKGYIMLSVVGAVVVAATIVSLGLSQAMSLQSPRSPNVASITIPEGSSSKFNGEGTFTPQVATVVIGVNNTVSWTNRDSETTFIEADNDKVDPAFFKATQIPESVITSANGTIEGKSSDVGALNLPNVLRPGGSFEYTFTIPGEYGYHGKPWQRGSVIVLPAEATK